MTDTKLHLIKDANQYAVEMRSLAVAYRQFIETKSDDQMRSTALSMLKWQHSLGVEVVDTYVLERYEREALQLGWIKPDWRDEWIDQKVVVAMVEDQDLCVHPKRDQLWLSSEQGKAQ